MRSPKDFFRPLAVGAPDPVREIPFPPSRMIHFFPASNPKMVAKVPDMAAKVDALYDSFYLLSYCSPARDGRRLMKVEVLHHDSQGVARKGTLFDEIDAVGFGAGCDPTTTPRFGAAFATEPVAVDAAVDAGPPPAAPDPGKSPTGDEIADAALAPEG